MKYIVILTLLIFGSFSVIGQKHLTLEDAVLEQYRSLYPQRMLDVQWQSDKRISIVDHQTYKQLFIVNPFNGDTTETIALNDISFPENGKVNMMYGSRWIDDNTLRVQGENAFLTIDVKKKTATEIISNIKKGAGSFDWSPKNDFVAYTVDNNLFVQRNDKVISVTNYEDPAIVSGQAIHRFEFGISKGTFWSPNGEKLAYYQKDESDVADYPLLDIDQTPGKLKSIKYPMAGQPSEEGNVFVFDVGTRKSVRLRKQGGKEDFVTNVSWSPDNKHIIVAELNRGQDHMHLNLFDANTGKFIKTIYEEKNNTWVEPEHPAHFVSENEFLWISEKDGFMNIYLMDFDGKAKPLTEHEWEVLGITGQDENGKTIFYEGTGESPLDKKLFALSWKNGKTWEVTETSGTHSTTLSPSGKYVIDQWSSKEVANKVQVLDTKGKIKNTLLNAKDPLDEYADTKVEIGTIKAADDQTDLYYRMIKPSDFDESKKYPVLVYVYGGPHAQMITNSYRSGASLWMHWMAEQGYIVFTVDGRGSAHRGFDFEHVIHRHLGVAEMKDQLKGVEFLKSQPYVDGDRMAVHGWSFGGFMTSSLMLRYPDTFKVGVAGGPVTDWKWYEVMYGERYMDQPEENKEGYKEARVMEYVDQLKGKLLLIHGTIDDVVVMQHNLALVQAFIAAQKQIDYFPYPMHKHNVRGKDRLHLMTKVLNYIIDNL